MPRKRKSEESNLVAINGPSWPTPPELVHEGEADLYQGILRELHLLRGAVSRSDMSRVAAAVGVDTASKRARRAAEIALDSDDIDRWSKLTALAGSEAGRFSRMLNSLGLGARVRGQQRLLDYAANEGTHAMDEKWAGIIGGCSRSTDGGWKPHYTEGQKQALAEIEAARKAREGGDGGVA